jgi:hypothetical protein
MTVELHLETQAVVAVELVQSVALQVAQQVVQVAQEHLILIQVQQ